MDPQATWQELLEARHQRDWDRAEELAENLLEWMNKKGFPPDTVGDRAIGRTWHHAVAQFICYMTLNDVKAARKRLTRKRSSPAFRQLSWDILPLARSIVNLSVILDTDKHFPG